MPTRDVLVTERAGMTRSVAVGSHRLVADEPAPYGGDAGPNPFEFVLAGLGTCTSMTLRMYADRHAWPLRDVRVRLRFDGPAVVREISLEGDLDDDQWHRLMSVAERCPVNRLLSSPVPITTVPVENSGHTAESADTVQKQK
ncbi:OsmC family protein [Streptomyces sp. NPDC047085]|uniref:OsmC family protein n=1 Tax=Streptomyces sp. NPDC047085 TaxID=3155140 RepID=UPI0033F174BE